MYKWLLFDMDGTLTNTKEGIINCIEYAFDAFGIKIDDRESLKKYIGPPLVESFSEYFRGDDIEKAVNKFRERYETRGVHECELFPGIKEMLKDAKASGKMTALATSKPEQFARQILKDFDIDGYIDVVSGAIDDTTTKEDVIRTALERAGVSGTDRDVVLMIGDRKYDIEGAKLAGVDALGVYYGFADPGELEAAGAKYVVNTVLELQEAVRAAELSEIERFRVR